jgi:hypothetical protein
MSRMRATIYTTVALGALALSAGAEAAPIFFGPTPYTSQADIPAGFYAGGPTALENFEDNNLGFGITGPGIIRAPSAFTDSVDGDDGLIDGFGTKGFSFMTTGNSITFTFATPVTAAALVFTDSVGPVTFTAFGPTMAVLGSIGPFSLNDGLYNGKTAEDRFLGVQDAGGIKAIRLSSTATGIEVDHVQYGNKGAGVAAPEPGAAALLGLALVAFATRRR